MSSRTDGVEHFADGGHFEDLLGDEDVRHGAAQDGEEPHGQVGQGRHEAVLFHVEVEDVVHVGGQLSQQSVEAPSVSDVG